MATGVSAGFRAFRFRPLLSPGLRDALLCLRVVREHGHLELPERRGRIMSAVRCTVLLLTGIGMAPLSKSGSSFGW